MKKFYTLFIVLFGSILFGQEYTQFLNPTNRWVVTYLEESDGDDFPQHFKYRLNPEGTITYNDKQYVDIQSKNRTEIWGFFTPWSDWESYRIYLSENLEEKKVFIYYDNFESPNNGVINGEFLLYDFDLEVGDSIPTHGFVNNEVLAGTPIYVTSIEYRNVFGFENVKTYLTDYFDHFIYEGIGSSHGLFTFSEFHIQSALLSFYQTSDNYTPLIQEGKGWEFSYNQWDFANGQMHYKDYKARLSGEQINYNDKVYHAIQLTSRERIEETPQTEWSEWETEFYLSENIGERKVYIYYPDETLFNHANGEFLLYDFSLEEGDVMHLNGFNETNGNTEAVVSTVTNENIFGIDNVRTYHFTPDGFDEFKVYQGIGASTGLITMSFLTDSGWTLTHYGILNNEEFQAKQTKIYPNPFYDKIQIQNSEEIKELQLFDLQGKLISTNKNLEELNLKLSSLNNAVYFLKIQFKNNKSETIKLIKNK